MSTCTSTTCSAIKTLDSAFRTSNNYELSTEEASTDRSGPLPAKSKSPEQCHSLPSVEFLRSNPKFHRCSPTSLPFGISVTSMKTSSRLKSNSDVPHPHALDLSASLKLALDQRFCLFEAYESNNNQNQTQQQETEGKDWSSGEGTEPHIDDEADESCNQIQHNDTEDQSGGSRSRGTGDQESRASRRLSYPCEPMVRYDEFLSASKLSAQISRCFFTKPSVLKPGSQSLSAKAGGKVCIDDAHLGDCDDDIVNICSPITTARSKKMVTVGIDVPILDDRRVAAAQDGGYKWTPHQFGQYYDLLGFFEHTVASSDDPYVTISRAQLGEMDSLLSSLLSLRGALPFASTP